MMVRLEFFPHLMKLFALQISGTPVCIIMAILTLASGYNHALTKIKRVMSAFWTFVGHQWIRITGQSTESSPNGPTRFAKTLQRAIFKSRTIDQPAEVSLQTHGSIERRTRSPRGASLSSSLSRSLVLSRIFSGPSLSLSRSLSASLSHTLSSAQPFIELYSLVFSQTRPLISQTLSIPAPPLSPTLRRWLDRSASQTAGLDAGRSSSWRLGPLVTVKIRFRNFLFQGRHRI